MRLEQVLKVAVHGGASDVILKIGNRPKFRHNGNLLSLSDGEIISEQIMEEWKKEIIPAHLQEQISLSGEIDFGFNAAFGTRFRVNAFKQRGKLGMVLRVISNAIKSIDDLNLPPVISTTSTLKRGLVLVTGATGSGKSTTLAAIVQKINLTRAAHIITIEDPIEFYYQDAASTINQREIGEDTKSFSLALRASLRQNPDVILVGELRDAEATETALMAAETGHLVLSTLHTQDAVDSLTRLMSYFPPYQHKSIRIQLANTLQMIVAQRLVPKADGKGRVAACEILVGNSFVKEAILNGENFESIEEAIKKGQTNYGMQSFDQALVQLLSQNLITEQQALLEASSRENMSLLLSGVGSSSL